MSEQARVKQWGDTFLRPLLIAGMLSCLMASAVQVLELVFQGWDGTYVVIFSFLAGMEGLLSERMLHQRGIYGPSYLMSRGAELVVLLLLLKFASYLSLGLGQLVLDARSWAKDLGSILTLQDMFIGTLFVCMWGCAIVVGRVALQLDVQEITERPPPDKASSRYYMWMTRPQPSSNREAVLKELGELFVWGGLVMLLIPAGLHLLASVNQNSPVSALAFSRTFAVPTLLYFVLGIALMSQGQFSVLRASWQIQELNVQQGIAARWLLWAIIFMVLIGVAALLLPTGYSLGPLRALLGLLGFVVNLFFFFFTFLIFLLTLPFSLLMSNVERPEAPAFEPGPVFQPVQASSGSPVLEAIISFVFWVAVAGIVVYALIRFLRDRFGGPNAAQFSVTWWERVLIWLRTLWMRWRTWGERIQQRLVRRPAGPEGGQERAGLLERLLFPGRMPPRGLIRYFYVSAARRAAQAGRTRRPGQTPYEYQESLDERFPDLEPDLAGLTEAFIRARYSHHPVEREDVEAVRPLWQRIKALLRRHRVRT
jgi:hypothetical protein